jgi:Glycosyl transferase family 2
MAVTPAAITVVTPVHGRCALVERLLASLAPAVEAFARAGGVAEILLVDSSEGEDARCIAALAERHGALVRRSANDVRRKRNLGVRHASGEVVLFVDSDCEADPGLLLEHAAGHRVPRAPDGRPVAGVLGPVRLTGERTAAWRAAEAAGFCDGFAFADRYPQADWGPCANVSYRRAFLQSVGGFREDWPRRLGGDDVELGLRVNGAGAAIMCRPGAVVTHNRSTWARWPAVLERAWRWGAMDVHVRAALPPTRRRPGGVGPGVLVLAATAAGAAGAARRRSARPLATAALAVPLALLAEGPPRGPLGPAVAGRFLRLLFDLAAVAEAIRLGRPALAAAALHPTERAAARQRARDRTATTAGALAALLPFVLRAASRR